MLDLFGNLIILNKVTILQNATAAVMPASEFQRQLHDLFQCGQNVFCILQVLWFSQVESGQGQLKCLRVELTPLHTAAKHYCTFELLSSTGNTDMARDPEEVLASGDASELDLTNAHLHTLEEVPIPETLSVSCIGERSPCTIGG